MCSYCFPVSSKPRRWMSLLWRAGGWRLFLCLVTARLFLDKYRYLGKVGENANTVQINPEKEGGYTHNMDCNRHTE